MGGVWPLAADIAGQSHPAAQGSPGSASTHLAFFLPAVTETPPQASRLAPCKGPPTAAAHPPPPAAANSPLHWGHPLLSQHSSTASS